MSDSVGRGSLRERLRVAIGGARRGASRRSPRDFSAAARVAASTEGESRAAESSARPPATHCTVPAGGGIEALNPQRPGVAAHWLRMPRRCRRQRSLSRYAATAAPAEAVQRGTPSASKAVAQVSAPQVRAHSEERGTAPCTLLWALHASTSSGDRLREESIFSGNLDSKPSVTGAQHRR